MTTGLSSSDIREESTQRFYAADAGIEAAIGQLLWNGSTVVEPFELNVSDVEVTVEEVATAIHLITSTATDNDNGKSTTIESYVAMVGLLDNAITSLNDVTIQPGSTVTGNVMLPGKDDLTYHEEDQINGEVIETDVSAIWPDTNEVSAYYLGQVDDVADAYLSDTLDLKDLAEPKRIGPLFRDGDLHVDNTGSPASPATATLEGTLYVTGNLSFDQPGSHGGYTIALDGHTIYADGTISFAAHRVTISGSGCIIARGDIDFYPDISSAPGDFLFVISLEGAVDFSPQADFYGALAGDVNCQLQPGSSLTWVDPSGAALDFPFAETLAKILTYTIVD